MRRIIRMEAKMILTEMFKEVKTLKEQVKKLEEVKMSKENITKQDTQTEPTQPAPQTAGTNLVDKGATADQMATKYEENEADKDTQAQPAQTQAPSGDLDAKKVGADEMSKKYEETEDEEKDVKKENEGEVVDETEQEAVEPADDQTKMVEILEALTKRIEALEAQVMPAQENNEVSEQLPQAQEEPTAPTVESLNLNKVLLKENVGKTDFKAAVNKLFNK